MKNKQNLKIGVTGASGFFGRRIIEMGLERNLTINAFLRPTSKYPADWNEKIKIFKGDISKAGDTEEFVRQSDIIIHLASLVMDWGPKKLFQSVTVNGTKHLLDHMKGKDKKIVIASSIAVYAANIGKKPLTEDLELLPPTGNYCWSKQVQEKLAAEYAAQYGVTYSIVRPGNVFGPYGNAWVHEFIHSMQRGPVLINGGNHNALCYIDNVATVFLLAALKEEANGRIYNASDDNEISWKEYADMIADTLRLPRSKSIPGGIALPAARILTFIYQLFRIRKRPQLTNEIMYLVSSGLDQPYKKAAEELGYKPVTNKQEALKKTREYVEAHFLN